MAGEAVAERVRRRPLGNLCLPHRHLNRLTHVLLVTVIAAIEEKKGGEKRGQSKGEKRGQSNVS